MGDHVPRMVVHLQHVRGLQVNSSAIAACDVADRLAADFDGLEERPNAIPRPRRQAGCTARPTDGAAGTTGYNGLHDNQDYLK